jgi:hypothetical protein
MDFFINIIFCNYIIKIMKKITMTVSSKSTDQINSKQIDVPPSGNLDIFNLDIPKNFYLPSTTSDNPSYAVQYKRTGKGGQDIFGFAFDKDNNLSIRPGFGWVHTSIMVDGTTTVLTTVQPQPYVAPVSVKGDTVTININNGGIIIVLKISNDNRMKYNVIGISAFILFLIILFILMKASNKHPKIHHILEKNIGKPFGMAH